MVSVAGVASSSCLGGPIELQASSWVHLHQPDHRRHHHRHCGRCPFHLHSRTTSLLPPLAGCIEIAVSVSPKGQLAMMAIRPIFHGPVCPHSSGLLSTGLWHLAVMSFTVNTSMAEISHSQHLPLHALISRRVAAVGTKAFAMVRGMGSVGMGRYGLL